LTYFGSTLLQSLPLIEYRERSKTQTRTIELDKSL